MQNRRHSTMVMAAGVVLAAGLLGAAEKPVRTPPPVQQPNNAADAGFERDVRPLLKKYCYECHDDTGSGGLAMDEFETVADLREGKKEWEKVIRYARSHIMPPADAEVMPGNADREKLVRGVVKYLYGLEDGHVDPGRVVVRRLNRVEYRNTVRDLLGVKFDPTIDFPQDDTGYGFDDIGDVLTLPPMLMEKYLSAAQRVVETAVPESPAKARAITGPVGTLVAKVGGAGVAKGDVELAGDRARGVAHEVLAEFARRAWRRPVSTDELAGVMKLYGIGAADGGGFRGGLREAMAGVLVSPSFLMRGLPTAAERAQPRVHPIGEYELAERLSYFIWSSTPDEELMAFAAKGELRKNLAAQVKRMLASPKADALSQQFGGQWLQFRNLDAVHPDRKMFEAYDDSIRDLMKTETETFFASLVKDDRSVLDLLTADYTFVNAKLANYYGIPGVTGKEFRRVSLQGTQRRGVLTQGSVLTITSNPTRTSPVKRGKWVLENLLGAEPPAPPPNLPTLEGAKVTTGTLRERLERHRADPSCAACHAAMDPIGLGLENYDAVGRWRDTDAGEKIDAKSAFPGGKPFVGAPELVQILAKDRGDDVMRAAAEKMLTFAIGRGIEGTDEPAIDAIIEAMKKQNGRFSALIMGVVNSAPFQLRRGVQKDVSTASAMAR